MLGTVLAMALSCGCGTNGYADFDSLGYLGMEFTGHIDRVALTSKVHAALDKLESSHVWTREELLFALHDLRIVAMPKNDWIDWYGRHVVGLANGRMRTIWIGADYDALCHEFAEVAYLTVTAETHTCFHCGSWAPQYTIDAYCGSFG